jgi:hypothetical protein
MDRNHLPRVQIASIASRINVELRLWRLLLTLSGGSRLKIKIKRGQRKLYRHRRSVLRCIRARQICGVLISDVSLQALRHVSRERNEMGVMKRDEWISAHRFCFIVGHQAVL